MDTFKTLQELYDCIEDVISSCDDMDLKIESVERLEIIYNKLKDNNNE